ncbi:uncharacterized protein LOC124533144 isoform X2 [Vanessa cardui]|uniref:uncharacterized protein LOC124533144 isoform X2 n=1 Tax=Vanessa cardui TaxID=171605 RepID=UPI001F138E65|nr:uncharacterized protein LOC124533144 isoform X2 [Vanessa cardui]
MPKRASDNSLEFIAKKLRQLEKEVKRSRQKKRNNISLSSSSSSSCPSSCSSRVPSPNPEWQETIANTVPRVETIDVEPSTAQNNEIPLIEINDNSQDDTRPSCSHEEPSDDINTESEARRNFALYSVKKELKDQLSITKIDKYLFGNDLAETLKTAKAVSKSISDLKQDAPKKPKPAASTKHLNWKARTSARRQPTGPSPRYQPPATHNAQHRAPLSQNYAQRFKQTRRP